MVSLHHPVQSTDTKAKASVKYVQSCWEIAINEAETYPDAVLESDATDSERSEKRWNGLSVWLGIDCSPRWWNLSRSEIGHALSSDVHVVRSHEIVGQVRRDMVLMCVNWRGCVIITSV